MADSFAQLVKSQADIVKIVGDYVKLRKTGAQNYTGLCPFHKEKTGSFSVNAAKQFYYWYLSSRGTSPDTIAKSRIGFAPHDFNDMRERLKPHFSRRRSPRQRPLQLQRKVRRRRPARPALRSLPQAHHLPHPEPG